MKEQSFKLSPKWLGKLKVGDTVIVSTMYKGHEVIAPQLEEVKEIRDLMFIVGESETRYDLNGVEVDGNHHYYLSVLEKATPKKVRELLKRRSYEADINFLHQFPWDSLPAEVVRELVIAVGRFKK